MKPAFETEAALCAAFIEWAKTQGWTCYAETAGWDILLVDKDGFQLGIEAKLKFNLKVLQQALPQYSADVGPDFRGILVPLRASEYDDLLARIGLECFYPSGSGRWAFSHHERAFNKGTPFFDWNPKKRETLPEYLPDVAAGVPSPLQLTPWKIGALKVMAHLQLHGHITRNQISRYGVNARRFTDGAQWLIPKDGDPKRGGNWILGSIPRFDQQHPEVYVKILAELPPPPDQKLLGQDLA